MIIIIFRSSSQPGDDIVIMAQKLEKIFLQKLSQMPQQEREISAKCLLKSTKKGKSKAGICHSNGPIEDGPVCLICLCDSNNEIEL